MNVRKPVDYGTMYRELTAILAQNLPQMDEIYAIGKAINENRLDAERSDHGSRIDNDRTQAVSGTGAAAAMVKERSAGHSRQRLRTGCENRSGKLVFAFF